MKKSSRSIMEKQYYENVLNQMENEMIDQKKIIRKYETKTSNNNKILY